MIPRALPRLITDALTNRWRVRADHNAPLTSLDCTSREADEVTIEWVEGRVSYSAINGVASPYAQCVRLLRSTE